MFALRELTGDIRQGQPVYFAATLFLFAENACPLFVQEI